MKALKNKEIGSLPSPETVQENQTEEVVVAEDEEIKQQPNQYQNSELENKVE